jgi:signal transduction histidine kinase
MWLTDQSGNEIDARFVLNLSEKTTVQKLFNGWKAGLKSMTVDLSGNELKKWLNYVRKTGLIVKDEHFKNRRVHNVAFFSHGWLNISSLEPLSPEMMNILERFAAVYSLTYRRFLDLQKAEAQAREAQIEASLERVRSRTMAMHKSDELIETAELLFDQLRQLGAELQGVAFAICDKNSVMIEKWTSIGVFSHPYTIEPGEQRMYEAWKNGEEFYEEVYEGERQKKYYEAFMQIPAFRQGLQKFIDSGYPLPTWQKNHAVIFKYGYLLFITTKSFKETGIFLRFGKVFEQTYTRFLDLQKAEVQAREAQIEASLERVRSKTMAMHNSADVGETVAVLFDELKKLGIETIRCGIGIMQNAKNMEVWTAKPNENDKVDLVIGHLDMNLHPLLQGAFNGWSNKKDFFSYELKDDDLINYFAAINNHPAYPVQYNVATLPSKIYHNDFYFSQGTLFAFSVTQLSDENKKICKRFAAVFGQTYRRYLDLQKAEAQAREAQIEAALERVRARSLAMHKSEELQDVIMIVSNQLQHLGFRFHNVSFVRYNEKNGLNFWLASPGQPQPYLIQVPYLDNPVFNRPMAAIKKGIDFMADVLTPEENHSWLKHLIENSVLKNVSEEDKKALLNTQGYARSVVITKNIILVIGNYASVPYSDDQNAILKKVGNVFEQAHTRFLDLQKAEAQAREAQIEAALERVRARTMAMQKSDELADVAELLFKQVNDLGIKTWTTGFNVWSDDNNSYTDYITNPQGGFMPPYTIDAISIPVGIKVSNAKKTGEEFYMNYEEGEALAETYRALSRFGKKQFKSILESGFEFPSHQYEHFVFGTKVSLMFITYDAVPEAHDVFKRFGKVFEQTYTRFLDLQKAEAQAREAKIEAALERIRSRSLIMQQSEELKEVVAVVFEKLRELGLEFDGTGIQLFTEGSKDSLLWIKGVVVDIPVLVNHPYDEEAFNKSEILTDIWQAKAKGEPVFNKVYSFEEKNKLVNYTGKYNKANGTPAEVVEKMIKAPNYTATFIMEKNSGLWIDSWSGKKITPEEFNVAKRIAKVFEQAYIRFLDLQKAEVAAKEALKQAALDRIRADIASMRTVSDLDRITPLIWNELTVLGVPFIRCGVFIMNDEQQLIHTFLSTPDGKAIAAFHIPYNTLGNIKQVISHWRDKKNYIDHWDENAFTTFAKTLVEQGALTSPEQYLQTIPHGGFYLHFLPFLQGMLYVANTTQLSEDEINLIQSLADAFSTAYARYEDFNKLEAAKQQVDAALNELQATQKQLVQSEKMASLGELTAGIAHEIQNPLNFVNNFSEVSNELIDEMKQELGTGNLQQATEIAEDIKRNLEKINHHGKRADAIVKGMLQHSRTSTGQKEPTDINALCDEYLRLSYHGLRAKDKSFNAKFETDFDPNIPKINVVPQEIGRVILNLINNAFYAVNEKQKNPEGFQNLQGLYTPTVTIATKKLNDAVKIIVSDNGNGIPQKILDKIFQPFFTTKPTGQGTGLGLSLSYDIVKAHGGDIKVKGKESEGSEFIIRLSIV